MTSKAIRWLLRAVFLGWSPGGSLRGGKVLPADVRPPPAPCWHKNLQRSVITYTTLALLDNELVISKFIHVNLRITFQVFQVIFFYQTSELFHTLE